MTLYLVPTPIGNLGDCTPRMRQVLGEVDFIAAEDTRVTRKLLSHLDIHKPLAAYHRHNTERGGEAILARILGGETCALVSDAGMPGISDPGEELVVSCAEAGVLVIPLAGPCALIPALAASGLPTGRFTFEGFLAMNKKNRTAHLDGLRGETRTMLFYEAPHKIAFTLCDLAEAFGADRRVSLCRELTKLHEEIWRTTLGAAAAHYAEHTPKGEFVLVVEGAPPADGAQQDAPDEDAAVAEALRLHALGLALRDAAAEVGSHFGIPKNRLYSLVIRTKRIVF